MRIILLSLVCLISACASVMPSTDIREPQIQSAIPINSYVLAIINDGQAIHSAVASSGTAYTRSFDPDDAIAGVLLKHGISRIYEAPKTNLDKTLLITWGVSGSRNIGMLGAYSQEITILMRQADNSEVVYKCTAEGIGSTEADDIREATNSCLSGL